MDRLAFELTRHSTYAKLSPEDLESMGKQAASAYLAGGISLNDAIVKIAKEHPSISAHQVRRIVEFANTETFGRLFEKQAGDKNIEFPVADPGEVLHSLDNGARPSLMVSDPPDYSIDPIAKTSAADVEADLALTKVFMGFDPASPNSEKIVLATVRETAQGFHHVDRILDVDAPDTSDAIDRILKTSSVSEEEARSIGDTLNVNFAEIPSDQFRRGVETELEEHRTPGDPSTDVIDTPRQAGQIALGHLKEIPKDRPKNYYTELDKMEDKLKGKEAGIARLAPLGVKALKGHTKKREAEKEKKSAMNFEAVPQRPPVQRAVGGGVNDPAAGDHPEDIHQKNVRALDRRIEIEKKKQELAKTQFQTQELLMGGGQPQQGQQAQQAAQPQAQAAPQAAQPMSQPSQKMAADLTKQAMDYVKSDRPGADKVLQDLRAATSLARIKTAAAGRDQYPMANPHGELFRVKQRVESLMDEALSARDGNLELAKQAQAEFEHHVTQFMFQGGNLGEVAHIMDVIGANSPGVLKEATSHMLEHLLQKGMQSEKTRAEMINYEMTKASSARTINPNNPIVESFSNFIKIASNQPVLDMAYNKVKAAFDKTEVTVKEVMRAAPRQ